MNNYKQHSIKCQVEKAKSSCKGVEIFLSHLIETLNIRFNNTEGIIISSDEAEELIQNIRAVREINRETFYWTQLALDEASTGLEVGTVKRNVEQKE